MFTGLLNGKKVAHVNENFGADYYIPRRKIGTVRFIKISIKIIN